MYRYHVLSLVLALRKHYRVPGWHQSAPVHAESEVIPDFRLRITTIWRQVFSLPSMHSLFPSLKKVSASSVAMGEPGRLAVLKPHLNAIGR